MVKKKKKIHYYGEKQHNLTMSHLFVLDFYGFICSLYFFHNTADKDHIQFLD